MCTLTIQPLKDGYLLAMNRDESRRRGSATRLVTAASPGGRVVYPQDADRGGTWLGANEKGVSLALLNRHPAGFQRRAGAAYRTRGELIVASIRGRSDAKSAVDAVAASVQAEEYPPFLLIGVDRTSGFVERLESNGSRLKRSRSRLVSMLVSSSSWDEARAGAARAREFRCFRRSGARADGAAATRRFHASHRPTKGPLSVCMHRDDARTVSYSQVRARRGSVEFLYSPGAPCRASSARARRAVFHHGE